MSQSKMGLSRKELMLTKAFLLIRICLYFFVLPCLRSIWTRMPLAPFAEVSTPDIYTHN